MNSNKYYYCNVEGGTDIGCKRKANEDWLDTFECCNGLVAVVCDGMGGHVGGQIASHLAVDAIRRFLENNQCANAGEAITDACNAANEAILQRAAMQPELTGMGSTCVMLIVKDGKVYIGSIGDSRVYLVRSKKIRQLTTDQSYVQMLVDMGQISKEEAEHHPRKNEITNALGMPDMRPATVLETPIIAEAGDCFILCSDGLSGMVDDSTIARIASNQTGMSQRERVEALINKAKKNGGLDNITCQIVEFAITPPGNAKSTRHPMKWIVIGLSVVAMILTACGLYFWYSQDNQAENAEENVESVVTEDPDMTIHNDCIIEFENDKSPVIRLEKNVMFNAVVIYAYGKDCIDTTAIKLPLDFGKMSVKPEEYVSFKEAGAETREICLNGQRPIRGSFKLIVTFCYNDSTFSHSWPVTYPMEEDHITDGGNKPIEQLDTGAVTRSVSESEPEDTIMQRKNDVTITLHKPNTGSTVTVKLISAGKDDNDKGNTDTKVYTNYAIAAIDKIGDWYSYSSNGKECTITIKYKRTPRDGAIIEIPLEGGPGDDKSFILRINKSEEVSDDLSIEI